MKTSKKKDGASSALALPTGSHLFMNENKLGGLVRTFGTAEIVSVEIYDQGAIVTLRERSNAMYACNPPRPMPDKVWREIFRYENGELRKVETQDGIHKPASYQPEELLFANVKDEGRNGVAGLVRKHEA